MVALINLVLHPLVSDYRGLAVVAAALSVAVVLAEAAISPALPNLSIFSRALHAVEDSQAWTEVLCCLSLVYPIAAAYYGLYKCVNLPDFLFETLPDRRTEVSRMGQFSFYLLVPRPTLAYSLLADATLCCSSGAQLLTVCQLSDHLPYHSNERTWSILAAVAVGKMCRSSLCLTLTIRSSVRFIGLVLYGGLYCWQDGAVQLLPAGAPTYTGVQPAGQRCAVLSFRAAAGI